MKTQALLFLIMILSISSNAQTKKASIKEMGKRKVEHVIKNTSSACGVKEVKRNTHVDKNGIERDEMGKSGNVYSVLHSEQRCLFYDEATNTVIFTHGADTLEYNEALGTNSIISSYQNMDDIGNFSAWENLIGLNPLPSLHQTMDVSGVLYNPDHSTSLEETYLVVAGPDYSDLSNQKYFASAKMSDEEHQVLYTPMQSENDWARSCMTTINDEVYIFGQDFETVGDYGKNQVLNHYRGSTSDPANGFEWQAGAILPGWLMNIDEGYAYALYTTWSAWKRDGSIGYIWMVGVTNQSQAYGVYQPQIFYTEDGGASWHYIPLDLSDNYVLEEYLEPYEDEDGNPVGVMPSFLNGEGNYPGAVDYDGRLHLFSNVYGSTTGDVTNPEEANWINEEHPGGVIFDFIIDINGLDDIQFVDWVYTQATDSTYGHLGWDHRLQTCKTLDEYNIFAIWSEDETSEDGKIHFPDIKGFSYCALFGQNFGSYNLTKDDLYEGFYFYPYVAEYSPGHDNFYGESDDIPISTSVRPIEYSQNDPNAPITHEFIVGAHLPTCMGGITEDPLDLNINISQNHPNPFKNSTTIEIYSDRIEAVSIQIQNTLGQMVYEADLGLIYQQLDLVLDLDFLEKGVYFYTIRIGEASSTKKMIKE